MKPSRRKLLATACAAALLASVHHAALAQAPAKQTAKCNTTDSSDLVVWGMSQAQAQHVIDVVAHPSLDPGLYDALWQPRQATLYPQVDPAPDTKIMVTLTLDPFQDAPVVRDSIRSSPIAGAAGISGDGLLGRVCWSAGGPPLGDITLTEYHNTILDHYFLSSTAQENASIDSGGAGPGWVRTGQVFHTVYPSSCDGIVPVFRFYSPSAHSHFFTADAGECGFVRNHDPNWAGEGVAFGARPPVAGVCPGALTALYRAYNKREAFNDMNHRYASDPAIYQQMVAQGWAGEGVVMCLWTEH